MESQPFHPHEDGSWASLSPNTVDSSPNILTPEVPPHSYPSPPQNGKACAIPGQSNHRGQIPSPTHQNEAQLRLISKRPRKASTKARGPRRAIRPRILPQLSPGIQVDGLKEADASQERPQSQQNCQPTTGMQPASDSQSNWRVRRRILQQPQSGAADPDVELRLPVLALSATYEKHAFHALFSQRLERSLVTASAVGFLGFRPMDLPPGASRKPFMTPWGVINPERFVRLVLEQPRNDLPPVPCDILVLDDTFLDRGIDIFVGKQLLAAMFNGNLPPKAFVATGAPRASQQPAINIQNGWAGAVNPEMNGNTLDALFMPPGTPLASAGGATSQIWGKSPPHCAFSGRGLERVATRLAQVGIRWQVLKMLVLPLFLLVVFDGCRRPSHHLHLRLCTDRPAVGLHLGLIQGSDKG